MMKLIRWLIEFFSSSYEVHYIKGCISRETFATRVENTIDDYGRCGYKLYRIHEYYDEKHYYENTRYVVQETINATLIFRKES